MKLYPLSKSIIPLDWQKSLSDTIVSNLALDKSSYLRGGTGIGKMYITCQSVYDGLRLDFIQKYEASILPMPILWLTPKNVKPRTAEVIADYRLTGEIMLYSYSELTSGMGGLYITWINDIVTGVKTPIWNINTLPAVVICDEAHFLKNPDSLRSRVIRALPKTVKVIFASATPFQRVADAQTMLEAFQVVSKYNTVPASVETSKRILGDIAYPKDPIEYSPSATKRLRDAIEPYMVEAKNVRFKHKATTKCVSIYFKNNEEQRAYIQLVQDLIDNLKKRRRDDGTISAIHILVERQKMQQGAELLRCNQLVERALAKLPEKAVIIASNYRDTIAKCHNLLLEAGVDPKRIAIIQGGNDNKMAQDKFQSGECDILLFTMKSGGVGISLHHDRVTTKPRYIILPPTWSAIDLVQALGRGHRLTTISPTEQEILWYAGTIEDEVKLRVELKLNCITESITAKEQFSDTFTESILEELESKVDLDELDAESIKAEQLPEAPDSDDILDDSNDYTGEGLSNNS